MSEAEGMLNGGSGAEADAAQGASTPHGAAGESQSADADSLSVHAAGVLADIRGKLARYSGPAYRKAYLANLVDSGKRFLIAGNARGAEYCFTKVAEGVAAAKGKPTEAAQDGEDFEAAISQADQSRNGSRADGSSGSASLETSDSGSVPESDSGAGLIDDEGFRADARTTPRQPRAARTKAKERLFRRKWRQERLKDAEAVLNRHGGRLSSLEFQAYRDKLDKLSQSGLSARTPAQSDKADAGLLELRRRLYGRVLKSQKMSLKRQRMPMTLARLALPPAARGSRFPLLGATGTPGASTVPAKQSVSGSAIRVDTAWQPVIGPYNDRYNMEDLLSLIADADAAWVEEFLDLYRGLSGLQNLTFSIASLKKS